MEQLVDYVIKDRQKSVLVRGKRWKTAKENKLWDEKVVLKLNILARFSCKLYNEFSVVCESFVDSPNPFLTSLRLKIQTNFFFTGDAHFFCVCITSKLNSADLNYPDKMNKI